MGGGSTRIQMVGAQKWFCWSALSSSTTAMSSYTTALSPTPVAFSTNDQSNIPHGHGQLNGESWKVFFA